MGKNKRLNGGSSPHKKMKYENHGPITEKNKKRRMMKIIKGFKNPENYEVKDNKIIKKAS